jgi:hypothetical protein
MFSVYSMTSTVGAAAVYLLTLAVIPGRAARRVNCSAGGPDDGLPLCGDGPRGGECPLAPSNRQRRGGTTQRSERLTLFPEKF